MKKGDLVKYKADYLWMGDNIGYGIVLKDLILGELLHIYWVDRDPHYSCHISEDPNKMEIYSKSLNKINQSIV